MASVPNGATGLCVSYGRTGTRASKPRADGGGSAFTGRFGSMSLPERIMALLCDRSFCPARSGPLAGPSRALWTDGLRTDQGRLFGSQRPGSGTHLPTNSRADPGATHPGRATDTDAGGGQGLIERTHPFMAVEALTRIVRCPWLDLRTRHLDHGLWSLLSGRCCYEGTEHPRPFVIGGSPIKARPSAVPLRWSPSIARKQRGRGEERSE